MISKNLPHWGNSVRAYREKNNARAVTIPRLFFWINTPLQTSPRGSTYLAFSGKARPRIMLKIVKTSNNPMTSLAIWVYDDRVPRYMPKNVTALSDTSLCNVPARSTDHTTDRNTQSQNTSRSTFF
ncbi:MAG: hypothetical protein L3J76_06005 [Candidatus Hydrothermae bacterium]|nr:hypothetical protein [Candidatus Hydrothermae bacterium]